MAGWVRVVRRGRVRRRAVVRRVVWSAGEVLGVGRALSGHPAPGTRQPGEAGNVGLAGHRNTHGEPFRRLDRLGAGDVVRIETRAAVNTYAVDRVMPRTTPGDGGVLAPVPRSGVVPGYGRTTPGHYLTLTTCTPQFTSTYRLVVWAKLVSVRGR